ncbi:MAG: hypothetical protein ACXVIG_02980 [Halobacteriota archaeon]
MVCNCDASHFKASSVDVPDHIQAYWDAQFSTVSHSSYRRRLKRWTKRYLPGELLYDEAFSVQDGSHIPNLNSNGLRIAEALNVLSGRKLRAGLKSRFLEIQKARMSRPEHLFENIVNFTRTHHVTNGRFSDDDTKLLVESDTQARP